MKSSKITSGDIAEMLISSLPTRPNAPSEFGGKGFSAQQMKEAFDRLPLYIIECFNRLIDDITETDGGSVTDAIKTDITPTHTLKQMLSDIKSGEFSAYLAFANTTLSQYLLNLRRDIDTIANRLGVKF